MPISDADLAAEGVAHEAADSVGGVGVVRLEEHQLGDGTLDGHVAAADDTRLLQVVAAVVA